MWLKPSLISHSSCSPSTTHLSKGCSAFQGGTLQGPRSLHLATLGQPHSSSPAAGLPTSALCLWSPSPTRGQGHPAKMALLPTGNRVLHDQFTMGLSDLCAPPPWPHWPLAVPPEPSQDLCSCCPPAPSGTPRPSPLPPWGRATHPPPVSSVFQMWYECLLWTCPHSTSTEAPWEGIWVSNTGPGAQGVLGQGGGMNGASVVFCSPGGVPRPCPLSHSPAEPSLSIE